MEMNSWSIGYSERERLLIEMLSPPADDCGYDWISTRATIDVGGFHGDTQLMITLSDMKRFRDQLQNLYKTLKGEAEFTTIEDQVRFKLTTDGLGHIGVNGHLMDNDGMGNKLTFSIGMDQTFLRKTITELEQAIATAEQSRGEQCH
jgi:hypothetical protein